MSAQFKNEKKKLSQNELRRIMKDHKSKLHKTTLNKIESPLARYNEAGQLTCVLCKSIVRSEAVWVIHLNSKQHKENVEAAKKLKEKTNNFTAPVKRPSTPPPSNPSKKLKGILKNSNARNTDETPNKTEDDKIQANHIPDDFFDNRVISAPNRLQLTKEDPKKLQKEEQMDTEELPEGFFDDPKLDAKARNLEYKDPVEEEWEKFQREIREADNESAAIIADDEEEATNERQLDEIDEAMRNWSRVLELEKKVAEVKTSLLEKINGDENMDSEDSSIEDDFDEFVDWRSKRAFK